MIWKYIKKGFLIIVSLLLLVFIVKLLSAIDWSKQHTNRVANLPNYATSNNEGEFRLAANGFEFLIRVAGMNNAGPAVILLHGFPETSLMWKPLLEKAAREGYRVVAFDQRGYSPKARPKEVSAYQIDSLVQDVLAVADEVGFDTFHLVGHDWGAGVGWKTVMDFPERIHTWTAMAIPHTGVFFKSVLEHPEQQKRSAYIQRLQQPFLPELLFLLNQSTIKKRVSQTWMPDQVEEYLAVHREWGATTAALNWYRAVDMQQIDSPQFKKSIHTPTLFIWGANDRVVAPDIIPLQKKYLKGSYQELRLETGHSLIQAKTDSVIQAIFLLWDK